MNDIFILGSCVTRDVFNFTKQFRIANYFSRTSLISLMSAPAQIDPEDVRLESAFQQRIVRHDLEKDFFAVLSSGGFLFLIIDFIDERFNLVKYKGSMLTRSNEFVRTGLEEAHPAKFEMVKRHTAATHALWEKSCGAFVDRLKPIVSPRQVILHKAFWSRSYHDGGQVVAFPDQKLAEIEMNNRVLERYYTFFERKLPGVRVIQNGPELHIANKNHIWGLSPFHYEERYYLEFIEKLNGMVLELSG